MFAGPIQPLKNGFLALDLTHPNGVKDGLWPLGDAGQQI